MRVYVYNCSNTYNYGSMMMGENFISYLNKISKNENKYYIETKDESNILRLREATNSVEIFSVDMDALFKKVSSKYEFLFGYFKIKNLISEFINEVDLIVVLGGDDFTEDYGWKTPILSLIKLNLLAREGIKVIMLGQTMGPYYSFRKPIMKKLLRKIYKIYPRDPITYKFLKKFGLKNISMTDDLALLPLTKQEKLENTKEYITYCPSELIYKYTVDKNRKEWVYFNKFIIEQLMQKYNKQKLVLIAHVLKPENVDDRKIVNELYYMLEDKYKDRIILNNQELHPYQVRHYIQQSLFTISSRMHPIISSIQCEIPVIAISYSNKYWGIIGERYGLKDFIIDVRQLDYKEMHIKLIQLLDKIEKEYKIIQDKMHKKNKVAKESIFNTLKEISKL